MTYSLGVDLGTSFLRAAICRGGRTRIVRLGEGSALVPSLVYVSADGQVSIGASASTAEAVRTIRDVKRRLGDPQPVMIAGQVRSAVSLLAAMFESVVQAVTAAEGQAPERIVLTCPAVWGPYRREHFDEVVRQSGLTNVTVLTEPEAAAAFYHSAKNLLPGDLIAVYDLGGGTFDTAITKITATSVEVLGVPEGLEWVGGIDFDEAVMAFVDRAMGGAVAALDPADPDGARVLDRLRSECNRAKQALSYDEVAEIDVVLPYHQAQVKLTRSEFEEMIRPALESTVTAVRRALASASVRQEDLTAIALVGGSSRIPLVTQILQERLGRQILTDPDPQFCVALGAAATTVPPPSSAAPVPSPPMRPRERGKSPSGYRTATIMVLVLVAAAFIGFVGWRSRADPPRTETAGGVAAPLPVPGTPTDGAPAPSPSGSQGATPTASTKSSASDPTTSAPAPKATPSTRKISSQRPSTKTAADPSPTKKPAASSDPDPDLPALATVVGNGSLCLNVGNGLPRPGNPITVSRCNATEAQKWDLSSNPSFRALEMCMEYVAYVDNPQIQLANCDGGPDQRWAVKGNSIRNPPTGRCLSIPESTLTDRIPLVASACNGTADQSWTFYDLA